MPSSVQVKPVQGTGTNFLMLRQAQPKRVGDSRPHSPQNQMIEYSNEPMTNHGQGRTARAKVLPVLTAVVTFPLMKLTIHARLEPAPSVVADQ